MTIEYLKKAEKTSATGEDETRKIVADMLAEIEAGGEETARAYGAKLDKWDGNIIAGPEDIERASAQVSEQLKDDIKFAYERVRGFAENSAPAYRSSKPSCRRVCGPDKN